MVPSIVVLSALQKRIIESNAHKKMAEYDLDVESWP